MTTLDVFRKFIINKYSAEYDNFDEENVITERLCDFIENIFVDVGYKSVSDDRKWFNWFRIVNQCIEDDGYEYYHYKCNNQFEQVEPDETDLGYTDDSFVDDDCYFIAYYKV